MFEIEEMKSRKLEIAKLKNWKIEKLEIVDFALEQQCLKFLKCLNV
jgi:hypothetical protein